MPNETPDDPFGASFDVPVAGGALYVAQSGPAPSTASGVVLAVHGISGSHVAWRAVARELADHTEACLLAADLRGRGRSAALPRPYGIAAHVSDLTAVLDHVGVERVVIVGHSLGAHIAARIAAEHPARVSVAVLADGGLPFLALPDDPADESEQEAPAAGRMETPCRSTEEYLARWRSHGAFRRAWNADVEAYARYDMVRDGPIVRCVVDPDAVQADGFDLMFDGRTRTAITRVRAPIRLLRATHGADGENGPMIPLAQLEEFVAGRPHVRVEHVADTNHYTLLLGESPGPARVAAAIESALRRDS